MVELECFGQKVPLWYQVLVWIDQLGRALLPPFLALPRTPF